MPSSSRLGSDSALEVSYNGDEDDDEEVIEEEDEMMVGEEGGVDEVVEEEEQMEGGEEDGEEDEVEVYEEDEGEEEVEDEDEMVVGEEDGVEEVDNEVEEEEEQVKGGKEDGEEDEVEVEEEDEVEVEEEEEEEQVKGGKEDGEEDEAEVEEEEEEEQVKGDKEDGEEDEVEVEEEDEVEVEEEEEEQMKGGDGDNEEDEVEEEEVEVKGEEEVEEEEEDRGDGRKEGTILPRKDEMGKEVEEEDEMKDIEEDGNEEGEDEVMEEQGDEQMKGCKEDAEEDEGQEQVDGGKGCDVLPNKEEMDTSEKIQPQELGEGPKSVSCTPVRFNSNQTPLTNGGNGGNVTSSDPSDEADSGAQLGKETTAEASKDSKEVHDSQVYLVLGGSMAGKNTKSYHEKDKAVESKNVKCDDVIEKEAPNLHSKMVLQTQEVLSLSSVRTPQRRPRSSSPDATIENANKRPGIICDFFARGWCIKGNSCRFLHQKEGFLNTNQQAEELAGTSRNGNFLYPGSREISQEIVDSSNTESSSKSPLTLQRALVRAYGGEGHGLPKFHNAHDMHEAHPQSGRASYPRIDEFRQTLVREEYERPLGKIPPFDTLLERRPADYDSLSRRYPNEDRLFAEMPRWDSLNGSSLTSGSPLRRNTLVPEYGYSGGSSTASSLHQNCNYPHAYDRKRDDTSIQNQQIHIPFNDPYKSYSLSSSLTSGFSNLSNAEHLDTRMMSDFDRGNYGSRSASLPKNSSPYYTRSEAHNTAQHEDPRDLAALAGKTTKVQHAWAPSLSFRPSFCHEPANISSYGNQYDPLLDSIELPKTSSITFQNSQHMNGGPILSETHYHAQEPLNAFPQSHEAILNKSISPHGLSGFNSVDGGNIFMPKEDKQWIPDHAVDDANVNEADPGGNMRNIEEKGRNNKDSRALKFFHAALVDFVKELVKPSWREGHLSKDAHKMVVKKAVEKVLSAIQPHQVPTTTESVNQYFSTSRPKLLKLVEGYVVKYTKSGAS